MRPHRLFCGLLGTALALLAAPAAAHAQQYLGKDAAAWAKDLGSNDPAARRAAAFALGKVGNNASAHAPALVKLVKSDGDPSVKEAAAFALGEVCKGQLRAVVGGDSVVPALTAALDAKEKPLVKRSAAVALGKLEEDGKTAAPQLEGLLNDADPAVRQNAAWALGRMKVEAVGGFKKLLTDQDPLVRRDAANALEVLGPKGRPALPELLDCCRFPDGEVRKSALAAIIKLVTPEDEQALAALGGLLQDKDANIRLNAALAMANIGGAKAAPAVMTLVDALNSTDVLLRRQAAAGLKNIGKDAVVALPALTKALNDPDTELRINAAVALGGLQEKAEPAVPDLIRLLTKADENEKVRVEAAVALSRIGDVASARSAIPDLIRVVREKANPPRVRERTLWVLRAHQKQLPSHPEFFEVLGGVVSEARTDENRMLRYDAAFLLGVFKRAEAPPKALDVLHEFLKDDSIKIYRGTSTVAEGGGGEKGVGKAAVRETGVGDGRVMAVLAVTRIGSPRIDAASPIMKQLRALDADPKTLPDLRKAVREALEKLAP